MKSSRQKSARIACALAALLSLNLYSTSRALLAAELEASPSPLSITHAVRRRSSGPRWLITGNAGTAAGSNFLGTIDNQALEFKVNAARALQLEPNTNGAPNIVGGSSVNFVQGGTVGATISGGGATNYFGSSYANSIAGDLGTIGGGANNHVQFEAVGSTVGGGLDNAVDAGALASTVPGGFMNEAGGSYSFAAGQQAKALHQGAFVWADSQNAPFASTANDQFLIRAQGGVGIGTASPDATLTVNGSADKPGGGSWGTYSDARLKNIGVIFTDGLEALEKIQPVHYHYKSGNPLKLPTQPDYVGVVAQEVQQAVPEAVAQNKDGYLVVNNDPIIWTMVNAIKELKAQNEALKERLDKLEQLAPRKERGRGTSRNQFAR